MSIPKNSTDNRQDLRDHALSRSVLYGALSLGLHHPTDAIFQKVQAIESQRAFLAAASFLTAYQHEPTAEEVNFLASDKSSALVVHTHNWVQVIESFSIEQWLDAHARLFGHTARGLVCPYETEYGQQGIFAQPRQLSAVLGYYIAFGLTNCEQERERPDHISCELEFMEFLARKEAYALESNDEEMRAETRKAVRLFLKDHLGRFGRSFARLLREQDPKSFHGKLGDVLLAFLSLECRLAGVEQGPSQLELRPEEEDHVPMACEGQSDLVQLQAPK
ncbi:MAG: hypothetical protein A3F68_08045 [Acidobacteria bacterium RIFCSPLOWO2_12_FULL_54_10]|nr:MAG: hypothetical protein A3F68_08045 [Acidobacteria bacterium RIFCSPLOWO2_12_FULL_54_10]